MKPLITLILVVLLGLNAAHPVQAQSTPTTWWNFQAIDTMKFSRDPSREFLSKPDLLQTISDIQVKNIAATGANYVAIATPYDDEFLPILRTWVAAAHRYHLHIWFRGNWSGWEGWFGYAKISRDEHLQKTVTFIKDHPEFFSDGDIFSACPECENGGPGDPRLNGDVTGHRQFLIAEYQAMNQAFREIDRNVQVNFNSMNGDVARLIMDKPTTQALGGVVVIDHYVKTPDRLNQDISDIAQRSGGQVVLGEFGAPIPDIHGTMNSDQQAAWLDTSLQLLSKNPALIGLSYWTNVGGTTAIWTDDNQPKPAVAILQKYFSPLTVSGQVTDPLGDPVASSTLETTAKIATTDHGQFTLAYLDPETTVTVAAKGYQPSQTQISNLINNSHIQLQPLQLSWWYRLKVWWRQLGSH